MGAAFSVRVCEVAFVPAIFGSDTINSNKLFQRIVQVGEQENVRNSYEREMVLFHSV